MFGEPEWKISTRQARHNRFQLLILPKNEIVIVICQLSPAMVRSCAKLCPHHCRSGLVGIAPEEGRHYLSPPCVFEFLVLRHRTTPRQSSVRAAREDK